MLAGKPPYDGETDVQALMALTSGLPPVPMPPSVPSPIVAVVKRALTPSADARFATAADMQQALEEAMTEAKLATSVAAVASFLGKHVGDRAQKRKDAIAFGLKAAAERDRVAQVMRSNAEHAVPGSFTEPGSQGSLPGLGGNTGTGMHSVTSGTLGSAAIDVRGRAASKSRTVLLAAAAGGGIVGLAGLLAVLMHSSSAAGPSPAASPAPRPVSPSQQAPAEVPAARDAAPSALAVQTAAIPELPATALPKVAQTTYASPPAAVVREAARPAAPPVAVPVTSKPAPPAAPPSKKRIDDGF
jgi:hypothetical protein